MVLQVKDYLDINKTNCRNILSRNSILGIFFPIQRYTDSILYLQWLPKLSDKYIFFSQSVSQTREVGFSPTCRPKCRVEIY